MPPPIRIVPASPALPAFPLSEPVVRLIPAFCAIATLADPVVFAESALRPIATLLLPVVFEVSAATPAARSCAGTSPSSRQGLPL